MCAAPRGNKNAVKNKAGRPTLYKQEYCQKLIDWFTVEPIADITINHYRGGEVVRTETKQQANPLPKFHEFAASIGVTHTTLLAWTQKHPRFAEAYAQAKELQKFFLIENGLNGCYNAAFATFVCKNITDMKDKTEVENKGLPPAININVDSPDTGDTLLKLRNVAQAN